MRRAFKLLLVVLAILVAGIQFVRPARTNPAADPADALTAYVPAHVAAILDRSCRDCHSSETRWPWYSNIAPASWLVIDHVNHGRSHFNYSNWPSYDTQRKLSLRKSSCDMARAGTMPMPSYLLMHRSAQLSPGDIAALCEWAVPVASHQWE
jgi:hypothetical protein